MSTAAPMIRFLDLIICVTSSEEIWLKLAVGKCSCAR